MEERVSRMRRAAEVIARIQRQTEAATEEEIRAAVDSPGVPSSEATRLTSSTVSSVVSSLRCHDASCGPSLR